MGNNNAQSNDPFSVLGEMVTIKAQLERGVQDFESKLNELYLTATITQEGATLEQKTEQRRLIQEAGNLYRRNSELIARGHEIRDKVQKKER